VPELPKIDVQVDCGDYLLRTLRPEDASDRWADWMTQPKNLRLLNSPPKAMSRADVANYIGQFDQRSHLLIGIFEKRIGLNIGFFRVDIDARLKRCVAFLMIGEQKYRRWTVTDQLRVPFQDYIFDTLGMKTMSGTALTSNRAMVRYLLKSGWSLDKTADVPVKLQTATAAPSLSLLSLSREAWIAWKKKNLRGVDASVAVHRNDN
jgi:RimJ/RimL family protein N-acetyltransferase